MTLLLCIAEENWILRDELLVEFLHELLGDCDVPCVDVYGTSFKQTSLRDVVNRVLDKTTLADAWQSHQSKQS